jgi:FSR family fosmidomycin resistance protein-like MFS transporter
LLVLAFGHLVIDLASGTAHYGFGTQGFASPILGMQPSMLYNTMAFGMQPLWGLCIDHWKVSRWAAIVGVVCVGLALLFFANPVWVNILAGTGNALYHLGAGVIVLSLYPGKAWPLGVFVGPGAIGIATSRNLALNLESYLSPVVMLLVFILLLLILLPQLKIAVPLSSSPTKTHLIIPIVLLLLVSTAIRSHLGMVIGFPWKSVSYLAVLLMFALALGKILGGFAADHWGKIPASAMALIIAAPLLAWGSKFPLSGLLGVILFQSTMAVTLLVLYEQMPKRPAFSFGLLCFGLWIGVLLNQGLSIPLPKTELFKFSLIIISSTALCVGFWLQIKPEHKSPICSGRQKLSFRRHCP